MRRLPPRKGGRTLRPADTVRGRHILMYDRCYELAARAYPGRSTVIAADAWATHSLTPVDYPRDYAPLAFGSPMRPQHTSKIAR
jgi:hypothetical protein